MNISNNHINGLLAELSLDKNAVTPCYDIIYHSYCFGILLDSADVVALGVAIVRVIGSSELVDALASSAVIEHHRGKRTLVFWPGIMCPDWETVLEPHKVAT
jgi:hypothetical protein